MIEVFKTNVCDPEHANSLLEKIHASFTGHSASFDLDDCDRVLRVQCHTGSVESPLLISLLKEHGYHAEILPDH